MFVSAPASDGIVRLLEQHLELWPSGLARQLCLFGFHQKLDCKHQEDRHSTMNFVAPAKRRAYRTHASLPWQATISHLNPLNLFLLDLVPLRSKLLTHSLAHKDTQPLDKWYFCHHLGLCNRLRGRAQQPGCQYLCVSAAKVSSRLHTLRLAEGSPYPTVSGEAGYVPGKQSCLDLSPLG